MNQTYKVQLTAVEKSFYSKDGMVEALGPVNLDIEDGEFSCIVGPSGCGKSTLLRIIGDLTNPSSGQVKIRISKQSRVPVAIVFQDYGIFPWKTVLDNVQFGLRVSGFRRREAEERARDWLDRLRLGDFADRYPDQLSGGMRQRVAIARALALEPEILLMDEPFAALDAQLRHVLQDELLKIWQDDQRTVIFITHSLEEAIVLGDRVIVMSARPGNIIESVDVPFDRPRSNQVRSTAEFAELKQRLWDSLRLEVESVNGVRADGE